MLKVDKTRLKLDEAARAMTEQTGICYAEAAQQLVYLLTQGRIPALAIDNGRLKEIGLDVLGTAKIVIDESAVYPLGPPMLMQSGETEYGLPSFYVIEENYEAPISPVTVLIADIAKELGPFSQATKKPSTSGGRPPKYDWLSFYLEAARFCYWNGEPEVQARLEEHMASWCVSAWADEVPATSEIRKAVARVKRDIFSPYKG